MILLVSYENWIDRTGWLNRFNCAYLALAQASLPVGVVLLSIGVLDGLDASIRLTSVSVYSIPVQFIATVGIGFVFLSGVKYTLR